MFQVEEANRDAVPLIHQRGIAGQCTAASRERDLLGQVAEIPIANAAPFDARIGLAESELRRLAELALEREEIASDGGLAPGVVDDAEIHAEVVGQRSAVPRVLGNGFADAALNEAAEFVFE